MDLFDVTLLIKVELEDQKGNLLTFERLDSKTVEGREKKDALRKAEDKIGNLTFKSCSVKALEATYAPYDM